MIDAGVATNMLCGALFCPYGTSNTVGPSVGIGGGPVPPVEVSKLLRLYVLVWYPGRCDKTEFWAETPPVTGIGAAVPLNTGVVVGSTVLVLVVVGSTVLVFGCLRLRLYHTQSPMSRRATTPPAAPPTMGARSLWELPEPERDGDVVSVG